MTETLTAERIAELETFARDASPDTDGYISVSAERVFQYEVTPGAVLSLIARIRELEGRITPAAPVEVDWPHFDVGS